MPAAMRLHKRKSRYDAPLPPQTFKKANSKRLRLCQAPPASFADNVEMCEMWSLICEANDKYARSENILKNHPVLSPQMRAILLDWIMDVCEAYRLHRETLHLSVDFLDRYLLSHQNVLKSHLQLLGITCLFVAAKIQEIYPPKLSQFSFVTDGACTEKQILEMELVLMKALKWKLNPLTSAGYLNLYLQLSEISRHSARCSELRSSKTPDLNPLKLFKPSYPGVDYVRGTRMLDLVTFDISSLKFSHALLASATLYHLKGRDSALSVTGYSWEQLAACVNFMAPYAMVLSRNEIPDVLPANENVPDEERHLVQAQCVSLKMLDQAQVLASSSKLCSPLHCVGGLVTPPNSSEKPFGKL